ncbi:PAS domain S-box protein [Desulfovibrio inopinatus]|uniref:PAS domain S-box protein n=1 Tax=Desulfovibrio inopinatus TaxID=102109 RepID=UPI0004027443|nr:PAS domain S-box protein [Desulfovibrio inopinatus]
MLKKQFGERIRFLRKMANLTQAQLAERINITQEYVGKLERGLSSPGFDKIEALSHALNVEPAMLFLFPSPSSTLTEQNTDIPNGGFDLFAYLHPIGTLHWDVGSDSICLTDGFEELLGHSKEKPFVALGKLASHLHPDDKDRVVNVAGNLIHGEDIPSLSFRYYDRKKNIRHALAFISLARSPHGGVNHIYCGVLDTTEYFHLGSYLARTHQGLEDLVRLRTKTLNEMINTLGLKEHELTKAVQSLAVYKKIVGALRENITFIDKTYTHVVVNASFLKATGLERNDVEGRTVAEIWGEEPFKLVIKPKLDLALSGKSSEARLWLSKANEAKRLLNIRFWPYREDDGSISGVVVSPKEIRESKTFEYSISHTRNRVEDVLRVAKIGWWDDNLLHDEVVWNDESYRILGYSPSEVRPGMHALLSRVPAEDKERIFQELLELRSSSSDINLTLPIVTPAGEERVVHILGNVAADQNGTPCRAIGTIQDVTALMDLEEQFHHNKKLFKVLAEQLNNVVLSVNSSGQLLFITSNIQDILGYEPAEALRMHLNDLIGEVATHRILNALTLGPNAPALHFTSLLQRKNESALWAQIYAVPLCDPASSQTAVNIAICDINLRKQWELALTRTLKALNQPEFSLDKTAALILETALTLSRSPKGCLVCFAPTHGEVLTFSGQTTHQENGELKTILQRASDKECCHNPECIFPTTTDIIIENNPSALRTTGNQPQICCHDRALCIIPAVYKQLVMGRITLSGKHDGYSENDAAAIAGLSDVLAMAITRFGTTNTS